MCLAWFALVGCSETTPGGVGDRCNTDFPCKSGLRCSYAKKRCYRPVDCNRLEKRLAACTPELLAGAYPAFRKLGAARRVALVRQVTEHLRTEVVTPCRYDAWQEARKLGRKPAVKRSWGEDPRAAALNACLGKAACRDFARCLLEEVRLLGPRAPRANRLRVLPLDPVAAPPARPTGPSSKQASPTDPRSAASRPTERAAPTARRATPEPPGHRDASRAGARPSGPARARSSGAGRRPAEIP